MFEPLVEIVSSSESGTSNENVENSGVIDEENENNGDDVLNAPNIRVTDEENVNNSDDVLDAPNQQSRTATTDTVIPPAPPTTDYDQNAALLLDANNQKVKHCNNCFDRFQERGGSVVCQGGQGACQEPFQQGANYRTHVTCANFDGAGRCARCQLADNFDVDLVFNFPPGQFAELPHLASLGGYTHSVFNSMLALGVEEVTVIINAVRERTWTFIIDIKSNFVFLFDVFSGTATAELVEVTINRIEELCVKYDIAVVAYVTDKHQRVAGKTLLDSDYIIKKLLTLFNGLTAKILQPTQ